MARNAELVRQWEILRAIDSARCGVPVARLAAERDVHPRTIRRDLDALSRAGFPLYTEKINGTSMWKLRAKPFRSMEENGIGLTELAALRLGRATLSAAGGSFLEIDAERALMKIERTVPASSQALVDQLPRVLSSKSSGRKKLDDRRVREIAARAFDAIVRQRRATMRYSSASSARTKEYGIEPHRLSCACGGVYLIGWVPAYGQLRTFALERIETLALTDERFERRPQPAESFGSSLGVPSGPPEPVEIELFGEAVDYVRARDWHRSQQVEVREDGSAVLRLEVCHDMALRSWVLGFGSRARVVKPLALARAIAGELQQARAAYLEAAVSLAPEAAPRSRAS